MISETQKRAALLICQYAALSTYLDAPDPHPVSVCSFVLDPAMLRAALIHLRNQTEDALKLLGVTV